MRVDLDAKVRTSDGEDAGTVERVVVDPHKNEVTEFVLNTGGLLGRDVRIAREEIERASRDGDVLRLRLTKAELERLPTYVSTAYGAPPAGWVPPAGYGFPYGSFLWPVGYATMEPYPVTAPGAHAGATAADAAGPGMTAAGAATTSTDELPQIGKDAIVLDRNGEDIGVVDDVRFDAESGALRGFVLRVGGTLATLFGGGTMVDVDASMVDRVDAGIVRLNATKDAVEHLANGSG